MVGCVCAASPLSTQRSLRAQTGGPDRDTDRRVSAFPNPGGKVWKALTHKDDMKLWYFDIKEFRPEAGFEFSFEAGPEGNPYVHLCRITEVDPFKKIAYTWKYEGYSGESKVLFELFADGNKTRLRLTHSGLDTFPSDVPDLAQKNFEDGWSSIIGTTLPRFLRRG